MSLRGKLVRKVWDWFAPRMNRTFSGIYWLRGAQKWVHYRVDWIGEREEYTYYD